MASLAITNAFAQDALAFDVLLALWLGMATVLASTARRQDSYGFALIGFTVPIVTLSEVSQPLSVFQTAADRLGGPGGRGGTGLRRMVARRA